MWPFDWFRRRRIERLSDGQALERYKKAGACFGDAVSYIYMGECIGFDKLHADWASWEVEVVRRGYRTFSIDEFADLGGWGKDIPDFGARLKPGEKPIFHAERYREAYLGKIQPAIDFNAMLQGGGPQFAQYVRPSTQDPEPDPQPYRDPGSG